MMRTKRFAAGYAALILMTALCGQGFAQTVILWSGGDGSYSDEANWAEGFLPDADLLEEAEINAGTAFVDDMAIPPAGVTLGRNNVDVGALEIRNGGNLTVSSVPGRVQVGATGQGLLTVFAGGELSAEALASGGSVFSSIVLENSAAVTVNGTSNLTRNTRIVGPDVDFSTQTLTLGGGHALTTEINAATHTPINVTGTATLNGALHIEFNNRAPTNGDTWDLIDAANVAGGFNRITFDDNVLPAGTGLVYSTEAGGANGNLAKLSVETQLSLTVDRRTGQVSLDNRNLTDTVEIDGYLITSAGGEVLSPENWNSLNDQGETGWTESNPSSIHLGELNLGGSKPLPPEDSISLGNLYSFSPVGLGEAGPDLAFEYHLSSGETKQGQVNFEGLHNNVVLLVDPESGAAAIQNQSEMEVELDGYLITSPSGSLATDDWTSLQSSGQSDWTESNPSAVHIGELNLNSSLALGAVSTAIPIGSPFDFDSEAAQRDLLFEFHVAGGATLTGVVAYGSLLSNPLDCNGDGVVNAADLDCTCGAGSKDALLAELGLLEGDLDGNGEVAFADFLVLSGSFGKDVDHYSAGDVDCDGTVAFADFLVLSGNFGKTSGAIAAVPEPSSWSLAGLGLLALLCRRKRT